MWLGGVRLRKESFPNLFLFCEEVDWLSCLQVDKNRSHTRGCRSALNLNLYDDPRDVMPAAPDPVAACGRSLVAFRARRTVSERSKNAKMLKPVPYKLEENRSSTCFVRRFTIFSSWTADIKRHYSACVSGNVSARFFFASQVRSLGGIQGAGSIGLEVRCEHSRLS